MDAMTRENEEEILAEPEESSSLFITAYNSFIFLQTNAWYFVAFAAIAYYLWTKKLSSLYYKWLDKREAAQESANMKKDPEAYSAREEARLAAVRKLQEEYNRDAVKMQEVMKQKEEKKREQFLEKHGIKESGSKLNEDYNPLVGSGGSNYRAARRSTCPGGSCNR